MTRYFNIFFLDPENEEKEIAFEIDDGTFVDMFNKLITEFGQYCAFHYDSDPCWILSVKELGVQDDELWAEEWEGEEWLK